MMQDIGEADYAPRWAAELRTVVLALNGRPTLADVSAVQRLLARQPTLYLGGPWIDLVVEARRWLERVEARLPAFPRLPPDELPVVTARPIAWAFPDVD